MFNRIKAQVQLDRHHARAVCQGIGERLRDSLDRNAESAPAKLRDLFSRLPELDRERAPSIVPSALPPATVSRA